MTDPVLTTAICLRCRALLDADDNYCRRCGAPTGTERQDIAPTPADSPKHWENPWAIVGLLLAVIGPFALPLVWRSRRFTFLWKYILTIVSICQTVLVLWLLWFIMHLTVVSLSRLVDVLGR